MKPLFVATLLLWSASGLADTVVLVHEEPFHRSVMNTSTHRILDVAIPPGRTTLYHTHAEPTLYVTLRRTTVRAQRLDQEWGEPGNPAWAPGDIRYDGAAIETPFTHRVENLGEEDFRLTLIASYRREPNANPDLLAAMPGKPGLDNAYFTQSRIDLEAGRIYDYDGMGVNYELTLVMVTDGRVSIIGESSDAATDPASLDGVGDVAILGARYGLRFENPGDQPISIIAVAVR